MISDKEKIDILLKEYDHRFEEVKFYSERYHQQSNHLNILLTLIVGFIAALLPNWDKVNEFFGMVRNNNYLLPFILVFVLVLTNYFYSLQNDSLAMLYLNGIRISVIEKKINAILGENLLMWDNSIIPAYHSDNKNTILGGMVKPTFISWLWSILVLACVFTLFVIVCALFAPKQLLWFLPLVLITGTFHIYQSRKLNGQGVQFLVNHVHKLSNTSWEEKSNGNIHKTSEKNSAASKKTQSQKHN